MASKGGRLFDIQLKQWIRARRPVSMSDGGGLIFTLSATGHAAWVLRYRHGMQRPEMTLGPYPAIGPSDARTMALVKRAELAQGRNPLAERRKVKAAVAKDWTVRRLIQDYRKKKLISLAPSTQRSYGRHLATIDRKLGTLGVREVEGADVVQAIEDSKLTWGESNMMLITCKCVFTHACGKRLLDVNPCRGIMLTALLGPRPPVRKRLMHPALAGRQLRLAAPGFGVDPTQPRAARLARRRAAVAAAECTAAARHHGGS